VFGRGWGQNSFRWAEQKLPSQNFYKILIPRKIFVRFWNLENVLKI